MKEKARAFFDEAKLLFAAKKYDGAASRLYYALYHAIIVGFDENGIKQSQLTKKMDNAKTDYWLHEVVRDYSTLAGVERRERGLAREMWELRTRADYKTGHVLAHEIQSMIPRVASVLDGFGIRVD